MRKRYLKIHESIQYQYHCYPRHEYTVSGTPRMNHFRQKKYLASEDHLIKDISDPNLPQFGNMADHLLVKLSTDNQVYQIEYPYLQQKP